jgi:protein phosphatase
MIQLTVDHSLYEKWKTEGMKGPAPKKNIITRAVGPIQSVDPYVNAQRVIPGDLFLICSDGLSGMIDDSIIEGVLSQTDPKNLEKHAQEFIDLANQNGGKDNVSVILVAYA